MKIKATSLFIVNVFFTLFNMGCTPDICITLEKHQNGSPKLIMCIIDENKGDSCTRGFYENGKIEYEFCLENFVLNGEARYYFPSGKLKSITHYRDGLLHGDGYYYQEDGTLDKYIFYHEDEPVYKRDYVRNQLAPEGFIPIVRLKRDTLLNINMPLRFEVTLPVPDSLIGGRKFVFCYQMKPESLMDSVLRYPAYEIELTNKTPVNGQLFLSSLDSNVFYGHLYNKANKHIYYPYEKKITILGLVED